MKELSPNETWTVEVTTALDKLILAPGSTLAAPEGKLLTMTVGGVDTSIQPGSYEDVVLAVLEDFKTPVEGYRETGLREALYVANGVIDPGKSAVAALQGGWYTGAALQDVTITSKAPKLGGVMVDGGTYAIRNLTADFDGYGGSDFCGFGTGICACGDAKVTVDGYRFVSHGTARNAVTVGGTAEVTVKNADITCYGSPDDVWEQERGNVPGMSSVPWVLGLYGNCRSTNVVGRGKATYIDSKIRADRWGVLSTDGVDAPENWGDVTVQLTTKNCEVEIFGGSGYGSYSIGACKNTFDNTHIIVPDYALVVANEYAGGAFVNGTVVDSDRFCVMWHQNQGGLLEVQDATLNVGDSAFLVKSCYPQILCERAKINSKRGIILQVIDSDDPGLMGTECDTDTEVPVKWEDHDLSVANVHEADIFKWRRALCTDVQATFRNMDLAGDFYNAASNAVKVGMGNMMMGMPPEGPEGPGGPPMGDPAGMPPMGGPDGPAAGAPGGGPGGPGGPGMLPPEDPKDKHPINMILTFEGVNYAGVISSTVARHNVPKLNRSLAREVSSVNHTPAPAVNNGAVAYLDGKSLWTVTGLCYLTGLYLAAGAVVQAPAGKTLTATLDGMPVDLKPGAYKGALVLQVQ